MNERIKELVDQILPNEKEWHKGDPKDWGYFFSGDELEKFAELIVKETMQVVANQLPSNQYLDVAHAVIEHYKDADVT